MVISAAYEMQTFIAGIILAFFGGVLFDFFLAFGRVTGKRTLFDILGWAFVCTICGGIWFFLQNGEIRWYMITATVLSAIIYFFAFEKYILAFFLIFAKILCKIFNIIFKILLTPLDFLGKMLYVYIKEARTKICRKVEDKNYEKTP